MISTKITLEETLELIGFRPGDPIALCHNTPGVKDDWHDNVIDVADVAAEHARLVAQHKNIWHSVNVPGAPIGSEKRGRESTVARINAWFADLDFKTDLKPGGINDLATGEQIINEVSARIGHKPTVVVSSGNGIQPYWPLEPDDADELTIEDGMALSRAVGALTAIVAEEIQPGVTVDNVADLSRVGRSPEAVNYKLNPVPTLATAWGGAPIGVQELKDRMAEVGIDWRDYIGEQLGDPISAPEGWVWNECAHCRWTPAMIAAWATDPEPPHRHNWMLNKKVKIEAARRLGCFPNADAYLAAHAALDKRFNDFRKPARYELQGGTKFAIDRVSRKTDEQVRRELGDHIHNDEKIGGTEPGQSEGVGNSHNGSETRQRILHWRRATEVADGVPEWAWEYDGSGAMMRNTLALFAGRPEAGKSTAARWFAAGYTTGTIAGCFEGKPQHVAYIAAEESIEYMVKPSLRAVGADLSRIHFPHVEMNGEQVQMLSSRDEDIITEGLIAKGITVVVIDPVMAGISGEVDINRNNEVRLAVQPWARIADRINGLGIGIVHLKKAPGGDVVAAINGSSAFGEIARAIIAFAPDDESQEGEHIMSQVKNSAGPGKPSITYTIENTRVETDGGTAYVGRFVMGDRSDRTVADVLSQSTTKSKLGPRMLEVLAACTQAHLSVVITPQYIADVVPDMTSKDAAKYLARAVKAELLVRKQRGIYGLPGA